MHGSGRGLPWLWVGRDQLGGDRLANEDRRLDEALDGILRAIAPVPSSITPLVAQPGRQGTWTS